MKKIALLFLLFFCDFGWSFDVQAFLESHSSKSKFNIKDYIYKSGPYKGEINYSRLFLEHAAEINKATEALGITFKRINDSTTVVIHPYETKTIIGGHDAYIDHLNYGKCVVTSWWPQDKHFYKKMKLVTCSSGTIFEMNQEGGLSVIYQGSTIQRCVEHWNNATKSCKKFLITEKGADDEPEEAYIDSLTLREYMRKAYGLTLLVTEYHSNGIPHIYKNVSTDNQYFVADSLGDFYKIVEYDNGFRYDKYLPMKEGDVPIMITDDSINFNTDYIFILNDDFSAIIDSVKRKDR